MTTVVHGDTGEYDPHFTLGSNLLRTPTAAAPPKPASCCAPLACATPGLDAAQLPGQVRAVVFLALALALVSALAAIAWVLLLFGVPAR